MGFIADKQTIAELNLLGRYKQDSIYALFNRVKTAGGERLLETMLGTTLVDAASINERTAIFRHFQQADYDLPFEPATISLFAAWLEEAADGGLAATLISVTGKKMLAGLVRDERYARLEAGVRAAAEVMAQARQFLSAVLYPNPYEQRLKEVTNILADRRLEKLRALSAQAKLTLAQAARYAHLLKRTMAGELETLLAFIAELDVLIAVGAVARSRNFGYALAEAGTGNQLQVKGLKHPALEHGVGNDLALDADSNVLFLTGANMAGKSTLMKSVGIALYLAHAGFPVAAEEMRFTVKDGLYSSINVPDNISLGYSHFYAEVIRVKQAAELVAQGKSMLVMFDELFKGTNVKDAYEGTLEVTKAFAGHRNCLFIVSTHIIEVGEALANVPNIRFGYMPTVMDGNRPRYTYRLTEGITEDRQGMLIIQNEGILDLLK